MEKFPIQPQVFKVSPGNPFEHDKLDRKVTVETLTQLVSSIEGPCVLALDALWGAGKTTFLNIWAQYLRDEGFTVVKFNAWETDFSGDPFVALCTEMTTSLDKLSVMDDTKLSEKVASMKKSSQMVIQHVISGTVRNLTAGMVDINQMSTAIAEQSSEPQRFVEYREAKKALEDFKGKLEELACALGKTNQRPLIVMIDELDRCRPTYAVELLETTKHLFSVGQIVFVLAVNHEQLVRAVQGLYGNSFDAEKYLRRFFDIDIRLPHPERDKYVSNLLNSTGIQDSHTHRLLQSFLGASELSLRDIAQAVHRLGLVLNSLPNNNVSIARFAAIALILRTLNERLYRQFIRIEFSDDVKEVTDRELADEIFRNPAINPLQWTEEGIYLQIGIALAYKELSGKLFDDTELEEIIEKGIKSQEDSMYSIKLRQAKSDAVNKLWESVISASDDNVSVFNDAYRLVELFSSIQE